MNDDERIAIKLPRASRVPFPLSKSLEARLLAYATAASAAGVGILALAQSAEARIIYTPADVKLANSSYYLVLNGRGMPNFSINNSYWTWTAYGAASLQANGVGSKAWVASSTTSTFGHHEFAAALPRGAKIPPGLHGWLAKRAPLLDQVHGHGDEGTWGRWRKGRSDSYLGLRFEVDGKTHYGWARLNVAGPPDCIGTLTGYAYETIPNRPIIAGKTKGPDVITEQPATLGHLAAGAAAIPAWRTDGTH